MVLSPLVNTSFSCIVEHLHSGFILSVWPTNIKKEISHCCLHCGLVFFCFSEELAWYGAEEGISPLCWASSLAYSWCICLVFPLRMHKRTHIANALSYKFKICSWYWSYTFFLQVRFMNHKFDIIILISQIKSDSEMLHAWMHDCSRVPFFRSIHGVEFSVFGKWWEHTSQSLSPHWQSWEERLFSCNHKWIVTMQAYFCTRSIPPKTTEEDIISHQEINKRF